MLDIFSLKSKVAFISGASGYLGAYMAASLSKAGAQVYINGRNKSEVFGLVDKLTHEGLNVKAAVFDITDKRKIDNFFDTLESGTIDILINNAYFGGSGSIQTASSKEYMASFDISVVSSHNIFTKALPFLRKAKTINGDASVINIASMYGMVSPDLSIYKSKKVSNPPFYGTAKAALIQWTKYAACEFAEEGIRFNSISPGAFPSGKAQENIELIENIKKKIPMNRIGVPEDLIGALIFLASRSSSYVTGSNIVVDGGWTAQ
jgi:NAD(P)-dependent dehydrogenase (short-subunit alcohol dehydrogenase family)